MKNLLKALAGITIPLAVVLLLLIRNAPRPDPAPPPPSIGEQQITGTAPGGDSPDGVWRIPEERGSYVGYRIRERRPRLQRSYQVAGRTQAVEGELEIADGVVEALEVTADLRELTSDSQQRDLSLGPSYLETDRLPFARFELSEPVVLDPVPGQGEVVTASVTGELTLHGVTRTVTVDVQARWVGDTIEIAGTAPVRLADYDIEVPNVPGFVFAADQGSLEFSLLFERAALDT